MPEDTPQEEIEQARGYLEKMGMTLEQLAEGVGGRKAKLKELSRRIGVVRGRPSAGRYVEIH